MPESNQEIPLLEYLRLAIQRNREGFEKVYEDPDKTSGDVQFYRSPCLVLIALLKSRREFSGLEGYEAAQVLDPLLEKLAPRSEDPWSELLPDHDTFDNALDPRDSVIDLWDAVSNPMELISPHLARAEDLAERFPLQSFRYDQARDKPFRRVVALAFWFARLHKGGTFFLGCRDAGKFAGCSHMQASQYLKRAQREGLLRLRQKSQRLHEANEYDFVLKEVAQSRPETL